ncbi:wings apart-like protein regulation of heterochromatin-domain-containing protein [Dissophora ornata]|nr:wings apart-like protein regulation of heterochromatin-domain-containing protein [Dissophora ornata]
MLPVPRKGTGSRPRQTYGRQRSVLGQDNVASQSMNQQVSEDQPHPHSLSPLKRANPDVSALPAMKRSASRSGSPSLRISLSGASYQQGSNDGGEISDQKTALRASHELREAGQSHRFKDEIEYILDGIRSKDRLKIRRTSCLDLTRSMLKEKFVVQVRTHHYMPTIFEAIKYDQDPIVFSCLALMIGIVLRDVQSCRDVVAIDDLVAYLCGSLEMDMDPMAMMPTARQDIAMYNDFKDLARQSGIVHRGQKILTKSIVLSAMTCIIDECVFRQDVHTLSIVDQDPSFLIAVIDVLIEDLAWIKQPSSTPGVSLPDVLDIDRIENCLRILERLALVSKRPAAMLSNNTRLFPLLVQLITLCRAHALQYPQHTGKCLCA